LPPNTSCDEPRATVPAPVSDLLVSSANSVRVAPDATVTAVLPDSAPPLLFSVRPPAETVVLPV
jgi:hypothetical protein